MLPGQPPALWMRISHSLLNGKHTFSKDSGSALHAESTISCLVSTQVLGGFRSSFYNKFGQHRSSCLSAHQQPVYLQPEQDVQRTGRPGMSVGVRAVGRRLLCRLGEMRNSSTLCNEQSINCIKDDLAALFPGAGLRYLRYDNRLLVDYRRRSRRCTLSMVGVRLRMAQWI